MGSSEELGRSDEVGCSVAEKISGQLISGMRGCDGSAS